MERRAFLKIGTVGSAAAVTGCGGQGTAVLTGLVTDPESIPLEESWHRGVCRLCQAGCGTLTRVLEGRAVKIEGDPEHPASRGGLCARGQAGLQALYHPDRLPGPLRRDGPRGAGRWRQVPWDEALAAIRQTLGQLPGGSLQMLTGRLRGHRALAARHFCAALGMPPPLIVEAFHDEAMRAAHQELLGVRALGWPDIAGCELLVSVGLSFVESGFSPVAAQRGLAAMRTAPKSSVGAAAGRPRTFVHIEPRYSLTAAAADQWLPARPGTELALLLALIALIVRQRKHDEEALRQLGATLDPAAWLGMDSVRAAEICDLPAAAIESLAWRLAGQRPACVLFGGIAAGQSNALAAARAVCMLNVLLGAYGDHPGGIRLAPSAAEGQELAGGDLADRLASGAMRAVICLDTDPAYLLPAARRALGDPDRVPLVISCAAIPDDTAALADWVLPDLTSWERPESDRPDGSRAPLAWGPAVKPFVPARSWVETLAAIAPAGPPWSAEQELIDQMARETTGAAGAAALRIRIPADGIAWTPPRHEAWFAEQPLLLLPCASLSLADGATSSLPWMQELTDPMSQQRWGSWIEINPRDARTLGISQGQWVTVGSETGRIVTRAILSETVMPGTAVAPAGQGHQGGGRYAAGRGTSIFQVLVPVANDAGHPAWGATRVAIKPADAPRGAESA